MSEEACGEKTMVKVIVIRKEGRKGSRERRGLETLGESRKGYGKGEKKEETEKRM